MSVVSQFRAAKKTIAASLAFIASLTPFLAPSSASAEGTPPAAQQGQSQAQTIPANVFFDKQGNQFTLYQTGAQNSTFNISYYDKTDGSSTFLSLDPAQQEYYAQMPLVVEGRMVLVNYYFNRAEDGAFTYRNATFPREGDLRAFDSWSDQDLAVVRDAGQATAQKRVEAAYDFIKSTRGNFSWGDGYFHAMNIDGPDNDTLYFSGVNNPAQMTTLKISIKKPPYGKTYLVGNPDTSKQFSINAWFKDPRLPEPLFYPFETEPSREGTIPERMVDQAALEKDLPFFKQNYGAWLEGMSEGEIKAFFASVVARTLVFGMMADKAPALSLDDALGALISGQATIGGHLLRVPFLEGRSREEAKDLIADSWERGMQAVERNFPKTGAAVQQEAAPQAGPDQEKRSGEEVPGGQVTVPLTSLEGKISPEAYKKLEKSLPTPPAQQGVGAAESGLQNVRNQMQGGAGVAPKQQGDKAEAKKAERPSRYMSLGKKMADIKARAKERVGAMGQRTDAYRAKFGPGSDYEKTLRGVQEAAERLRDQSTNIDEMRKQRERFVEDAMKGLSVGQPVTPEGRAPTVSGQPKPGS